MPPKAKNWCQICRDVDTDLACRGEGCGRKFHLDCLRNTQQLHADDDLDDYLCDRCREDEENDSECYLCKGKKAFETLILCDGCPRSAHLECLGVNDVPDNDWLCPICEPRKNANTESSVLHARVAGKAKLGNSDICYVCQKGGKLLGCDYCVQSFHPKCIDQDFLDFEADDTWKCPPCKGLDPLLNMKHKRLTRQERIDLAEERQQCIRREGRRAKSIRERLLWENLNVLTPFISTKTIARLKKLATNSGSGGRVRLKTANESSESEEEVEASNLEKVPDDSQLLISEKLAEASGEPILKAGVNLKDYQRAGVSWLLTAFQNLAGAILADEMGLGKTIQTLCFLSALRAKGINGPHLIVVPLSTVGNWAREMRRFVPHMTLTKICGSRFEREHAMGDPVAREGLYDCYITTYETACTEEAFFTDHFNWQTLILDEAHRIKTQTGRIRHSLDRVVSNFRILLTGTPLQNNIRELFTLINFLFPDLFDQAETFETAFTLGQYTSVNRSNNANTKEANEIETSMDENKIQAVNDLLNKLLLRRTKEIVIKLPKKIEREVWLPLSEYASTWYRRMHELAEIDSSDVSVRKLLGLVVKMRICCCHPRGMVGKISQLQKFKTAFGYKENKDKKDPSEPDPSWKYEKETKELLASDGWTHCLQSSKLLFLDRLLCQLHRENMKYSYDYEDDYETRKYDRLKMKWRKSGLLDPPETSETETAQESDKKSTKGESPKEEKSPKTPAIKNTDKKTQKKSDSPVLTTSDGTNTPKTIDSKSVKSKAAPKKKNKKQSAEAIEKMQRKMEEAAAQEIPNLEGLDDPEAHINYEKEDDIFVEYMKPSPIEGDNSDEDIQPHRVLIFTQFQLVLDELENYCQWRGWKYLRLDGSTSKVIRELDIREFNYTDSPQFLYLISTRAGGLGINLVTANHVVMYDEDWNPFIDMQAVDRAHRIGQRRDVNIWKLSTEWTVEEHMAFRRKQKLQLDRVVIQAQVEHLESEDPENLPDDKLSSSEIIKLLRHGSNAIKALSNGKIQSDWSNLKKMSIMDFTERGRRELPENILPDHDEEVSSSSPSVSSVNGERRDSKISVGDVLFEETSDALFAAKGDDSHKEDETTEKESVGESAAKEDDFLGVGYEERTARRVRARKQPQAIYVPTNISDKIKVERKINHERKCFRCSAGLAIKKTEDGQSKADDSLVQCSRCPKSYHQISCLGLQAPPKARWTCPWHECCICFRKSSEAGGVLLHCAECPTAFCYDCFPPDFRRYNPPSEYYENLTRRGWTVQDTFVLFLCSRCKALKEQDKRRNMSQKQLDEDMKIREGHQKEARADAKTQKDRKQQPSRNRKIVTINRRPVDSRMKEFEADLRMAYERLFPSQFFDLLKNKSQDVEKQKALNTKSKTKSSFKNPREFIRLCENCRLPFHDTTVCPFEPEFVRCMVPADFSKLSPDALACVRDATKSRGRKRRRPITEESGVKLQKCEKEEVNEAEAIKARNLQTTTTEQGYEDVVKDEIKANPDSLLVKEDTFNETMDVVVEATQPDGGEVSAEASEREDEEENDQPQIDDKKLDEILEATDPLILTACFNNRTPFINDSACLLPSQIEEIMPRLLERLSQIQDTTQTPKVRTEDGEPSSEISERQESSSMREEEKVAKLNFQQKTFCSNCGQLTRSHYRRNCSDLSGEDVTEYAERLKKAEFFLENVKKLQTITLDEEENAGLLAAMKNGNVEDSRRILCNQVDSELKKVLEDLEMAYLIKREGYLSNKSGRRMQTPNLASSDTPKRKNTERRKIKKESDKESDAKKAEQKIKKRKSATQDGRQNSADNDGDYRSSSNERNPPPSGRSYSSATSSRLPPSVHRSQGRPPGPMSAGAMYGPSGFAGPTPFGVGGFPVFAPPQYMSRNHGQWNVPQPAMGQQVPPFVFDPRYFGGPPGPGGFVYQQRPVPGKGSGVLSEQQSEANSDGPAGN